MSAYLAGLTYLRFEEDERCRDLSSTALTVYAAMASFAAEQSVPVFYGSQASIERRARLKRTAVKQALVELERAKVIERDGKQGKTIRWRLLLLWSARGHKDADEPLWPRADHKGVPGNWSSGDHKNGSPDAHKATEATEQQPSHARAYARDKPQTAGGQQPAAEPTKPTGAVRIVLDATDATPEEAAATVELIISERPVRDVQRLVGHLARAGELPQWLNRIRGARHKADIRTWLAWAEKQSECEHGTPGGNLPRPDTGKPQCPLCRVREGTS